MVRIGDGGFTALFDTLRGKDARPAEGAFVIGAPCVISPAARRDSSNDPVSVTGGAACLACGGGVWIDPVGGRIGSVGCKLSSLCCCVVAVDMSNWAKRFWSKTGGVEDGGGNCCGGGDRIWGGNSC